MATHAGGKHRRRLRRDDAGNTDALALLTETWFGDNHQTMPTAKPTTEPDKVKNLHVEVPETFHTRVKMLCVIKKTSMKDYALAALEEKVARDEVSLAASPRG